MQIGTALETLHETGRTHLDMKPSNIVLDSNKNAILIDISGTGGYSWEWLSPEMETLIKQIHEATPANRPFQVRVATDCWAYGKILSAIAAKTDTGHIGELMRSVADGLTNVNPESRVSLRNALVQLNEKGSE